jgi:hypothetical protein
MTLQPERGKNYPALRDNNNNKHNINNHDLQFLNNVYINKTKVLLSQTYVTLFMPFGFIALLL